MNPFVRQLKQYGHISAEVEQAILQKLTHFVRRKDDFLLRQGQLISSLFIMVKGQVRAFYVKEGQEVNTWQSRKNELFGAVLPRQTRLPSYENIQFVEDAEVYAITINDLHELYYAYPELDTIGRKISEELCRKLEEQMVSFHIAAGAIFSRTGTCSASGTY